MVFSIATTVRNALNDHTNEPGTCLMAVRIWAGIAARYPDAATAWHNTNDRHPGNRNPPKGSFVFWTGGSKGYGHIALSLGGGKVRSTDAGGRGRVATVDLGWVERNWGQRYAGWSWDVNEVTMPHKKPAAAGAATSPNWDKIYEYARSAAKANTGAEKSAAEGIMTTAKKYSKKY